MKNKASELNERTPWQELTPGGEIKMKILEVARRNND